MFKNIPSVCYVFFAVDDVIVTSVNTYMSMTGINTEDKYLTKYLPENKKYGARRLLKMFPNKNWSLDGLKVLMNLEPLLGRHRSEIVVVACALNTRSACRSWAHDVIR